MAGYLKRVEPWEAGLPKWTYYKDQTSGNYQGPYQYQGGQDTEGYYQGPYQYQGGQYKEYVWTDKMVEELVAGVKEFWSMLNPDKGRGPSKGAKLKASIFDLLAHRISNGGIWPCGRDCKKKWDGLLKVFHRQVRDGMRPKLDLSFTLIKDTGNQATSLDFPSFASVVI